MVYGSSNYVNSLSSLYKYNYNSTRSSHSTDNTAGIGNTVSAPKNSYVNSDAIKTLTDIRNNASALKDSLSVVTQASAFKKMFNESSVAENAAVTTNPAYEDVWSDIKLSSSQSVNDDTLGNINPTTASQADEDAQTGVQQDEDSSGKNDSRPAADAVRNLADNFNGLLNSANGNSRLSKDLNGAFAKFASGLQELGITSKPDGTLAVDSGKLDKAAGNGSLENFFNDTNGGGFADRLSQIASRAEHGGYLSFSSSDTDSRQLSHSAQNLSNAYSYSRNNNSYLFNSLFGASGGNTLGVLFNLYA